MENVKVEHTVIDGVKQPKVGDTVILHLGDDEEISNNQSKELPAIVTRVFYLGPPFTINMKGLPDGPGTIWRTSVMHQTGIYGAVISQARSWRWPDEELKRGSAPMNQVE